MKWYHWTEKEPEHRSFIIYFENSSENFKDLPPRLGIIEYYKYEGAWDHFKKNPDERIGWSYFCPISEFPFPDQPERLNPEAAKADAIV